jgi:hypothetical protein
MLTATEKGLSPRGSQHLIPPPPPVSLPGPGYRVYFGKDGDRLVILVGGGSKKGQAKDIAAAHERWADYKRRKRQEAD